MAERWEEIAEELESFDIDYYNARREQATRVKLRNGDSFYTPGDFLDAEIACKRIAELEAEVARKNAALTDALQELEVANAEDGLEYSCYSRLHDAICKGLPKEGADG